MSANRVGDDEASGWPRVSLGAEPTSDTRFAPGAAGHQLGRHLEEQLDAVLHADVVLRSQSSIVQPTAAAVRRMRHVLSVFDGFFEGPKAHAMAAELAWYAELLTPVEEADTVAERIAAQLVRLPTELAFPAAGRHVQTVLGRERSAGMQQLKAAMHGDRYHVLLRDIEQWRTTIPFTPKADRPITKVKRHLMRAHDEFRDSIVSLGDAIPERFNAALRAGERLDDAVEASQGALSGKKLASLQGAADLQALLREHRHSMMSAEFLDAMGAVPRPAGDRSGFTYGVLLERELKHLREIRKLVAGGSR